MRALGIIVLVVALIVLGFALVFPRQFAGLEAMGLARIVLLLLLALFVGASVMGMRSNRRGEALTFGRAVLYIAIWGALFAAALLAPGAIAWLREALNPNVVT